MRSALYTGTLVHARREPRRNAFRYPVAYFLLDLDELPELDRRLRFLSVNRPNAVSFHDEDYLDGDGTPLKQAVVRFCAERGRAVERVLTLTQLRVLGYVFNPVTFHWCYGPDGGLACIVAELSNTFGERLPELLDLKADAATIDELERQERLSDDVLRYLTVKVDQLEDGPSVLMHARTSREERSRRHDDGGRRGRDDDRPRDRDERPRDRDERPRRPPAPR